MKTINVAITGLKETGKTIFITSLINHLLEGNSETLPFFRDENTEFYGSPCVYNGKYNKFPYETYINNFKKDPPVWPKKTVDIFEYCIILHLRKNGITKPVKIKITDYPGERLLDAPMLNKNFRSWSEEVLIEVNTDLKEYYSQSWLKAVNNIDSSAKAMEAVQLYQNFINNCVENNLTHLQPALMVFKAEERLNKIKKNVKFENIDLNFCPLPKNVKTNCPKIYKTFAKKYNNYKKLYLKPFYKNVIKSNAVQIVLVDVLDALQSGVNRYNELRKCITDTINCYNYAPSKIPFYNKIFPCVKKVVFVATKADKCAMETRENLRYLLRNLVKNSYNKIKIEQIGKEQSVYFEICSAHRCTEDVTGKSLKGQITDSQNNTVTITKEIQDIPKNWENDWKPNKFIFENFLPPKLPKRDGAVINYINFDTVIYQIIKEAL